MGLKKRIAIIFGAVILVAAAAVLIPIIIRNLPKKPAKLEAFFHLYSSPAREQLASMLDEFMVFYPHIELEYHIEPYQDMRKLLQDRIEDTEAVGGFVSVLASNDLDLLPVNSPAPATWISSAWSLYYSRKHLEELGFSTEKLTELSSGLFNDFIAELGPAVPGGETLFSAGTSFYWPWLAWVQHLHLIANSGMSPEGYSLPDWSAGIRSWEEMVRFGYINPDFRSLNMAGSQLAVGEEAALFVLSDSSIYSTYHPEDRAYIEFIPFPGAASQGWRIGSGVQLAAFSDPEISSDEAEAEQLLLTYLHSEGIAGRFLKETGIRLLPLRNQAEVIEIPSLTQQARNPEIQDLLKYLR